MNVFVLSTGRCGSTTFVEACRHITNFTTAHESRAGILGPERLAYPPNHIESDNRLSWFLGRLGQRFPDDVFYVHLQRNRMRVAESYAKRLKHGMILPAYAHGVYLGLERDLETDSLAIALDYVDTVTANIEQFLADKPQKMVFRLENAKTDFATFLSRIGAEGDFDAAVAEFDRTYNAGEP